VFDSALNASIYCLQRSADCKQLRETLEDASKFTTDLDTARHVVVDLRYCRVHFSVDSISKLRSSWIVNRHGQTVASGFNVSVAQVLAFILKEWW
jgi:hypothetical protein